MAGPTADYRLGVPYGAQTEAEGRALVQTLKAKNVEMIKIWVDDRQQTVPKLQVNVYEAIINEAHKNGMRAVAHSFNLEDGKQLLKSGVDGFSHGVRDRDVDEEFLKLVKQHPKTWVGPNLPLERCRSKKRRPRSPGKPMRFRPVRSNGCATSWSGASRAVTRRTRAGGQSDLFAVQCRNLKKVHDAGMIIGLGTDGMAISARAPIPSSPTWCSAG
jgi:imidazolonepropionase-like amidohydrolase